MTYSTPEYYEANRPQPDIHTAVARIETHCDGSTLRARLFFYGDTEECVHHVLDVVFGEETVPVLAFTSHEEHHHPLGLIDEKRPKIAAGPWPEGAYPICKVVESGWIKSFGEARFWQFEHVHHYQIVSMDHVLDVLCQGEPRMEWKEVQQTISSDRREDAAPAERKRYVSESQVSECSSQSSSF